VKTVSVVQLFNMMFGNILTEVVFFLLSFLLCCCARTSRQSKSCSYFAALSFLSKNNNSILHRIPMHFRFGFTGFLSNVLFSKFLDPCRR
jgi:hypothetical protein